jgi:hypothetical protein
MLDSTSNSKIVDSSVYRPFIPVLSPTNVLGLCRVRQREQAVSEQAG